MICCWNNEKVYNDFADTLKAQTYHYELIGIDNRSNKGFQVMNQVRNLFAPRYTAERFGGTGKIRVIP
ncbi:MAG: hypothetical protein IJP54_03780 [Synergistaceae bacterium]|nr:hypothetical protein [Synergistaceae bacterium]